MVKKRNKPRTHGQPYGVKGSIILGLIIERSIRFCLPFVGPGAVGVIAEVVKRIPLGLTYSLLVFGVCEGGLVVCSVPSIPVVIIEGSFVWITRADDSSNDETINGKIVSDVEEFSVLDSSSLLLFAVVVVVSVGGMAWVALSIAVGRSSSSTGAD